MHFLCLAALGFNEPQGTPQTFLVQKGLNYQTNTEDENAMSKKIQDFRENCWKLWGICAVLPECVEI